MGWSMCPPFSEGAGQVPELISQTLSCAQQRWSMPQKISHLPPLPRGFFLSAVALLMGDTKPRFFTEFILSPSTSSGQALPKDSEWHAIHFCHPEWNEESRFSSNPYGCKILLAKRPFNSMRGQLQRKIILNTCKVGVVETTHSIRGSCWKIGAFHVIAETFDTFSCLDYHSFWRYRRSI